MFISICISNMSPIEIADRLLWISRSFAFAEAVALLTRENKSVTAKPPRDWDAIEPTSLFWLSVERAEAGGAVEESKVRVRVEPGDWADAADGAAADAAAADGDGAAAAGIVPWI